MSGTYKEKYLASLEQRLSSIETKREHLKQQLKAIPREEKALRETIDTIVKNFGRNGSEPEDD